MNEKTLRLLAVELPSIFYLAFDTSNIHTFSINTYFNTLDFSFAASFRVIINWVGLCSALKTI